MPEIEKRVELIENGINLNLFKKVKPKKVLKLIDGKINKSDRIILYPHRPDPSKGIYHSLKLLHKLKVKKKLDNLKLLIPHYIDEEITRDLESHYKNIIQKSEELGINENIIFHKWIPYELMPEYYSLGDLTLSIGNFIESFGSNVGLEFLACGTPVIMSLVGAQRYTLPKGIVPKVPYDDEKGIVELAYKILTKKNDHNNVKIREFIKSKFSHDKMLKRYEEVITNAKIIRPLEIKFVKPKIHSEPLILAPWACLTKFGIYNDYDYKYHQISKNLRRRLNKNTKLFLKEIKDIKIKREIMTLYEKGIFVIER